MAEKQTESFRTRLIFLGLALAALITIVVSALFVKNPPGPQDASVAVLPFADLSPERDLGAFCEGLSEQTTNALAKIQKLRVAPWASALAFKGKASDYRQMGQQLNVFAVLHGTVRKEGDRLKIAARLERVSDGTLMWSKTFEPKGTDLTAIQSEVSESIADEIRAGLPPNR